MPSSRLALFLLLALGASDAAHADSDDPQARLREQLRRTTVELRNTQDENAALKAKQAEADRQQQELTAQVTQLKQQLAQSDALAKQAADAKAQLDEATQHLQTEEAQLEQERTNLAKWQAAYQQAADVARTRDADAKRLAASDADHTRRLDDCVGKNLALYKLGLEILDRYQNKDLGDVLGEAEPFTQLARVKLENQVQDYQDKLDDQKVAPPAPKSGG